jgi:hypothetical protein
MRASLRPPVICEATKLGSPLPAKPAQASMSKYTGGENAGQQTGHTKQNGKEQAFLVALAAGITV